MSSRLVFSLVVLLGLPFLAGCGALFGSRFGDFTAYYNTFYNAQREFEREERTILRQDPPIDRTEYLPLFYAPVEGRAQNRPGLEASIRKSADVLRDHPQSRWVDDALLLIGKAYFYQGNADPAAQKFREVLSLPTSRQRDEATLWLGRSLIAAQSFGAATDVLREALDRDDLRPRYRAPLQLLLAEALLRQGDFEAAAEGLEEGLDADPDAALEARAAFLLGQVYEALDRPDDAARAFGRALGARATPELVYAATIERGLSLARADQGPAALALLNRLSRDDRFLQQRGEAELARARALARLGRPEEARSLLRRLLYDRESGIRVDNVRPQIHYHLGTVYRDGLRDYARAAAHFDTASTQIRPPAARATLQTREAIRNLDATAASFGQFARMQHRVAEIDSLLYLGRLDDDAFEAAIDQIREQRRREALARERERRRLEDQQGFGMAPSAPTAGLNGTGGPDAGTTSSGFLSFRDPIRVQESLVAFQTRWGNRPYVPNWRRAEAVSAELALRDAAADDRQTVGSAPTLAALRDDFVDVSAIPRTEEAQRILAGERAVARYELGTVLFLALGEPDTAAEWYRRVIEEDATFPVASRAYFALAEVERALGREDRADALLSEALDRFPDSPLSAAARERLGLPPLVTAPDSTALAEAAYAAAFDYWSRREHPAAFTRMLEVGRAHAGHPVAARARLAAGLIYTEWAAGDTLALIAPSPARLIAADTTFNPASGFGQAGAPLADSLGAPVVLPLDEELLAVEEDVFDVPLVIEGVEDEHFELLAEEPLAEEAEPVWLETLYASLEEEFAGTAYAARARLLREAVAERRHAFEERLAAREAEARAEAEAHAEAAALAADPEGALLPETATPDDEPLAADAPDDAEPAAVAAFDPADLRGAAPPDPAAGGYAWVLLRTPRLLEAQNRLISFSNRGFRVLLASEETEEGTAFVVLCGQFDTEAEALAAESALPIGRDARSLAVLPYDRFTDFRTVSDLLEGLE